MGLGRAANPLGAALRVAFAAVVVAAFVVDLWTLDNSASRIALVAVAGIAVAGVAWARWTRSTTVVALVVSVLSIVATIDAPGQSVRFALFTELAVFPVLFGVLLSGGPRSRWVLAGLVAFAGEGISLRSPDAPIRAIVAISMLVLLGTACSAVVYIRLRDIERRSSIDLARQNERLDLARELHDVVGHHVTGIVVLAQASRFTAAAAADPVATDQAMAAIEAAGIETLTSIRRLVGLLRTDAPVAAPPGLAEIEALVTDLQRTHPLTGLVVDEQLRRHWVPADLATTIQRIAQEATTNVRKHGDPAQPVVFTLRQQGSTIEFGAENGVLRSARGEGFGITGMRERVDALGGTFQADSCAGRWFVRTELPLRVAQS